MSDSLRRQIAVEQEQLHTLLATFTPLIEHCRTTAPGTFDIAALATMLHSCYGGIENILRRIADALDGGVPQGASWHAALLQLASTPTLSRPAVFSADLSSVLQEYMAFRHVFRHSYSFDLSWDKMSRLVLNVTDTCRRVENELDMFMARLPPH